jgi:uncharacterized protein (DUF1800 family)
MSLTKNTPIDQVDPTIAWAAWQPSKDQPWDRGRVCLLWRRGGLGANEQQIQQSLKLDPHQVVASFFDVDEKNDRLVNFSSESAALASSVRASGDMTKLAAWWLHRMLNSPQALVEKMTLFWHGHFATGAEKVQDAELMFQQNELLRKFALGDFKQLVHQISKDPAMLIYLDSVTNRKAHANENYARELMELFCLGEGNYSEADVQQLAKCFTGWEIRRKQFRFNPYQHDESAKSLLGTTGIDSGEQAIDVVLKQLALPRFIVGKLFQFFVCDEPTPPVRLLAPLEKIFIEANFSIEPVVKTILGSNLLLSGWSIGKRIRSPIELTIEVLRTLEGRTNLTKLVGLLKQLGQALFYPPNVKGWPGGRSWINSSTLIGRANLVFDLLNDPNSSFAGGSLAKLTKQIGVSDFQSCIEWIDTTLLAIPLTAAERDQLLASVRTLGQEAMMKRALIEVAALPRMHLS